MTTTELTPAEMADRTGVSVDTLRYYEKEGLITGVERAESGHRRYDQEDVLWVQVLRCLRMTGMSIEQLRRYCDLGEQGEQTKSERRRILVEHRAEVVAKVAELESALALIDEKLAHYEGVAE